MELENYRNSPWQTEYFGQLHGLAATCARPPSRRRNFVLNNHRQSGPTRLEACGAPYGAFNSPVLTGIRVTKIVLDGALLKVDETRDQGHSPQLRSVRRDIAQAKSQNHNALNQQITE